MEQNNNNQNSPASLFLTIDSRDNVINAAVKETSYSNSDNYLLDEIRKYDWGRKHIPEHMIVEYRFPNREAVPPLNPGVKNEYYGRDFYHTVDGRDIPRQYIPLQMAYFLSSDNYEMFQSEDVYNRIKQCREYREFEYKNNCKKDGHSERRDKNDAEALAAIRAAGGPSFYDIPLVGIWPGASAEIKHPNPITKTWNTSDLKKKPYTPSKRIVAKPVKPAKKRGIGI